MVALEMEYKCYKDMQKGLVLIYTKNIFKAKNSNAVWTVLVL